MTAEVKLVNFTGKLISCRALMDTCATANFLTEDMARKLNLRVEACEFTINAIDNIRTTAKGIAKITFQSIHGQFRKSLTCLIVPHISGFIPNDVFPREDVRVPSNIKLADPQFHLPQRVDLLIGSGATLSLLCVGQINLSRNECDLYAQKTLLGWVIVGEASSRRQRKEEFCRLANIIRCFAAPGVKQKKQNRIVSDECEIHYKLNTTRDSDGRYIVRLPFKDNRPDLGNTKAVAMRRFYGLIRKFKNDPEMAKNYWSVMQEYIDKGHMALVNSEVQEGYYLPHHAVIKNDSITTKVRVVFDASAKGDKGVSLNEVLLTGPVIQDKLTEHLIRIRLKRYMITADIEKMYRQILVHPDDRRYQRIVWFHQNEIRTFELKTVTFGVSSSSFLAIRTLKQLAEDEGDKYPIGARVLKENLYVDDLLAGANTLQEIIKIREELIALLRKGRFKIRKWASNNPQAVEFTDKKMSDIEFLKDETTIKKTLGICWNAANDEFSYNVQSRDTTEKVTKRIILSEVAKIYDPIGLLGPITFMAKVIVQECWKSKVHWDETLSLALKEKWSVFARQLSLLSELTVKRYLLADSAREIQIHGFCDASKSRVASLKEISIPRMELKCLREARIIKENRLASLNPFLNSDGLICVGGRLRNANMPMSQKHSILLPARSHFTDLIIREYHERYYHAGVQTTLYSIRQRFWILDGKNQVRKIVRGCVRCIRFHVKPNEYRMADLPVSRVEISTPFFHTGIDFFGPMFVKERKYRNKNRIKVYGCVFICMASKAVHIEIVSELSSDAFIAALRRFSGRRSTPAHIYTDNGTNFIGANRELRDVYALLESKEFKNKKDEYILKNKINWHFNPPLSPHFGGLWEAAVKSFKHHFKRVIGDKLLTLKEINTFAVEIEAILNSRPLCPISSDPNDPLSLTPAHLFIGKPLIGMPESDVSAIPDNRLNSWRIIQKIRLDFWRRCQLEYLSELQKRSKWFYPGRDVTIGSVVLLIERNQPCMHWSMGRILEVHPGDDGVVRVVTLRTAKAMQLVSLIVTFLQSRRVGEKIVKARA
ncbi:uncharacterized protein [Prorops nasuta]|uniref:uncharacterized protein n=1 Tax=Prorops nasuta TaxID=863751 RepID=UPI0034CF7582